MTKAEKLDALELIESTIYEKETERVKQHRAKWAAESKDDTAGEKEAEKAEQALHDELTGIFGLWAQREIIRGGKYAMAAIAEQEEHRKKTAMRINDPRSYYKKKHAENMRGFNA